MDKKLTEALNKQINNEFYSAYLYLSMAAYFDSVSLEGSAKWMKAQAKEEISHAMKLYGFLNDRGEQVILAQIGKPPSKFASPQDVFKKSLAHEKGVTATINKLYDLANKVKDTPAIVILQWYITEQVEEEKSATVVLEKLKMIPSNSPALLMLDAELGRREG